MAQLTAAGKILKQLREAEPGMADNTSLPPPTGREKTARAQTRSDIIPDPPAGTYYWHGYAEGIDDDEFQGVDFNFFVIAKTARDARNFIQRSPDYESGTIHISRVTPYQMGDPNDFGIEVSDLDRPDFPRKEGDVWLFDSGT